MLVELQGTPRSFFCVLKASATAVWTLALLLTVWLLPLTKWATRLLGPITALAGLTFGASWTLMAVITSELFGMKYAPALHVCSETCRFERDGMLPNVGWLLHDMDNICY